MVSIYEVVLSLLCHDPACHCGSARLNCMMFWFASFLHHSRYVLLKERNMLITVKHEARRLGFTMPAPERMWKVCASIGKRWYVTMVAEQT